MTEHLRINRRSVRVLGALALTVAVVATLPFTRTAVSAFVPVSSDAGVAEFNQTDAQAAPPQAPSRSLAPRIKLIAQITREVAFGEPITSTIVLNPAIARVEIKGDRSILITGLMCGDTILIISGKTSRITYALDVERPPEVRRSRNNERRVESLGSFTGSNSLYFTPGSGGAPSLMRESFEYSQKLTDKRTLRMSGEMFRFFGGGDRGLTLAPIASFGTSRLRFGLDAPTTKLDLLDSSLDVSRLGLSGSLLRGPHFVSTRDSRWRGLELFAGNASPQLTLLNKGQGRIAGAIMPVLQSKSLRVRSGFFFIAPSKLESILDSARPRGGMVLHTDARYTPDARTTLEGETEYGNGGLSWRAKLDVLRGAFTFSGELSSLDRHSPIIAIGAQSGGHKASTFNLHWQPNARLGVSAGYYRTAAIPPEGFDRIQLNSAAFLFSTNFRPIPSANFVLSLNQQVIAAPASALSSFLLNLQTRNIIAKYDQRFGRHWSNNLESGLIQSRETATDAQMNRGLTLREQLRFGWGRGSATGFLYYRSNSPTLESLILRSPGLLPVELRASFAADPVRFLFANRDSLPILLNGIQLPLTRNTETGVRLQSASSRLTFSGAVIYSTGTYTSMEQRAILASVNTDIKLDAANSFQISIARAFTFSGTHARTGISAGYVHRFGAGSEGGLQLARLLGLDRGHIHGRVFGDLNGNGQEDPGETGLAGMTVRLDAKASVVTDSRGDFDFGSLEPGDFDVELSSNDLGVTLRASKATLQHISLSARHTVKLTFGLTSSGFAAGRVFNDLLLTGEQAAGDAPGLSGVRLTLRPAEASRLNNLVETVDGNGLYEFRNLAPGRYLLEIDTATVPANFRLPAQTIWPITVNPLEGVYVDLPLAAQRAVSGIVFLDFDGDGNFTPGIDTPIPGASVRIGQAETITNDGGTYILRNVVAGKIEIRAETSRGYASRSVTIELPRSPTILRDVNLSISPSSTGARFEVSHGAQGVVSGRVYMDFDGDGKFNEENDTPIAGASVRTGKSEAITDSTGRYILRNIPAGRISVRATTSRGYESRSIVVEVPALPNPLSDVNLPIFKSGPRH